MASDKTRTQLKAYFETGDKPTQSQFADLVESNVNITDDSTINGKLTLADRLTRLTPEIVFKWNYINCAPPITTQFGNSDDGVLADGDKFSMIFPGKNGEMYVHQAGTLRKLASHATTTHPFTWRSKKIIVGQSTQNKEFYDMNKVGTATLSVTGSPTFPYVAKNIQFSITGTDGQYLDSAGVVFRTFVQVFEGTTGP